MWELKELTEYCQLLKKGSESALEVRRCTTKFSHLPHMRRRRSPVPMQVYIPVNSSICIRTLPQSVFIVWELKELTEYCQLLKKGLWKCSGSAQMYHEILPPCTHAKKKITCSNASLHPSEQFYMHKNTSAKCIHRVRTKRVNRVLSAA